MTTVSAVPTDGAALDYPLAFVGRVHAVRIVASKSTGREFGIISVYGAVVDSAGVEVLEVPSYDLLTDVEVAARVQRGRVECGARLEVVTRDGRATIALRLDL